MWPEAFRPQLGNLGERFINRFGMRIFSGAFALLLVGGAGFTTSPSAAADTPSTPPPQYCSLNIETGQQVCVDQEADLAKAVLEQTGYTLLPVSQAPKPGARSATPMATYIIGELYTWPNYGGTRWTVTASSDCTAGTKQIANFATYGWSNDVDSFKSFGACKTKLWENPNFTGSAYGYNVNVTDLGAMRNAAESGKWIKA